MTTIGIIARRSLSMLEGLICLMIGWRTQERSLFRIILTQILVGLNLCKLEFLIKAKFISSRLSCLWSNSSMQPYQQSTSQFLSSENQFSWKRISYLGFLQLQKLILSLLYQFVTRIGIMRPTAHRQPTRLKTLIMVRLAKLMLRWF